MSEQARVHNTEALRRFRPALIIPVLLLIGALGYLFRDELPRGAIEGEPASATAASVVAGRKARRIVAISSRAVSKSCPSSARCSRLPLREEYIGALRPPPPAPKRTEEYGFMRGLLNQTT